MERVRRGLLGVILGLLLSASLAAHHSFAAQYDRTKPVTLTGKVTRLEWMNPHVYFYIDVTDASGQVLNWAIEGGNPAGLYRNGWRKDSLKTGDVVTVDGWLARDGSNLANLRTAILADGTQVFGGSSGGDQR